MLTGMAHFTFSSGFSFGFDLSSFPAFERVEDDTTS